MEWEYSSNNYIHSLSFKPNFRWYKIVVDYSNRKVWGNERYSSICRSRIKLLEIVSEHNEISLKEFSTISGLNKATVHRLLSTLIATGYIEQVSKNGIYRSTYKLFSLGNKKLSILILIKLHIDSLGNCQIQFSRLYISCRG